MTEYLDIYDEQDNHLGTKERKLVHADGDWHHVINAWIYNSKGEILLQKRSDTKRKFPGYWDLSVGGHVSVGEDWELGLEREVAEEIGLDIPAQDFDFIEEYHDKFEGFGMLDYEIVRVYTYCSDWEITQFTPQLEEVQELEWVTLDNLREIIANQKIVPYRSDYTDNILHYFSEKFRDLGIR